MIRTFLAAFCCTLIAANTAHSQPAAPVRLDHSARTEIVNTLGRVLTEHYVFADTAKRMSALIRSQLNKGAYNTISDPVAFSDRLLADLRSVYPDGHLLVQYNPNLGNPAFTPLPPGAGADDGFRTIRLINFGFQKVEILPGNIGYIDLTSFQADRVHGVETMKGALRFVQNTSAIIIDLRSNGGGSQETATMLMGYFLSRPALLETFYNRATGEKTEYRTVPDSSFRVLWDKPVYVLVSHKSFSCAEMFAYEMKALKRGTLVGEITAGGAHGQFGADLSHGLRAQIPYWRGVSATTGTNWEGTGVKPDILCRETEALEMAEQEIFRQMKENARSAAELFYVEWQADLLKAKNHPVFHDTAQLKKFAGKYGERMFTIEDGKLHYQRAGRPKFELEGITANLMKGKNNNYFKVEFLENNSGEVNKVKVYYQDNRVEISDRD